MESTEMTKGAVQDKRSNRSIAFFIVAVIILCIAALLALLGVYEKRRVQTNAVSELRRYADSLVGQQLLSIQYVLEGLARNPEIVQLGANQGGQTPQLEKYLTGVAAGSGASIVYIMDKKGTVIGCSRYGKGKTLLGKNYSFRKYFSEAIEGEDVVFPAVGVTTNQRGFYFSTPVYSDSEKTSINAVVVIKMGVQRIENVLLSMDPPSGMITPAGIIFISNKKDLLFKLTRDIDEKSLEEILTSRQFGNNKLEKAPEKSVSRNGSFSFVNGGAEKIELLLPGWYLVQWRDLHYPVRNGIVGSILITVILTFVGLLLAGRRNRLFKDRELQVAKETAEENLRQGYETLRRILKSSPVAVFVCNQDMSISWLNRTARNMLELSDYDEAKAYTFGKRIHVVDEGGKSLIQNDQDVKIINVEGKLKADKEIEIPVLLNRTSFFRGDEELLLYSFLDLSERKMMEAELVHTRKMESIGQLAAGIAHEINSPAQFVGSNLDFIIEALTDLFALVEQFETLHKKEGESIEASIEEIMEDADYEYLKEELPVAAKQSREGIERITKIVLAMKAFSHPGDSNILQPADINEAIKTTLTVAANEWQSVAEVKLDLAPELPSVPCLIGELNQVFLNLIVNGAHAIEERQGTQEEFEKGLLKVTTSLDDDFVQVDFSDTGGGIPEQYRSKIFDPFFTTKEVGRGSGQGLYIARTLIHEQHNGTLTFETKDGVGTTFTIRLPVRQHADG